MTEADFAKDICKKTQRIVKPLIATIGAPLLYEITVDGNCSVTVDPSAPRRGQSAFETDIAVFQDLANGKRIPRVVIECKMKLTTHDILTYSAKAQRHKRAYPYLRYGMICAEEDAIPRRFFTHNDAIDFFVCAKSISARNFNKVWGEIMESEVESSKSLEQAAFGLIDANVYYTKARLARRAKRRLRK